MLDRMGVLLMLPLLSQWPKLTRRGFGGEFAFAFAAPLNA